MVGLLGVMAAGAARGARDASNMNVQEMNTDRREALRQKYETKKYNRQREDAKVDAKNAGLLNQQKYEQERANKLSDDELKHNRALEIEGVKESGRDRRNNARIESGSKKKGDAPGIQLEDGTMFYPNDSDSKAAANLVQIGFADSIQDAYRLVYARHYSSQAAGSLEGLTDGTVPTAKNMSGQLLQSKDQRSPQQRRVFNPKTGTFE